MAQRLVGWPQPALRLPGTIGLRFTFLGRQRKLRETLDLLDVRVLDHLIIGDSGICSFAELGLAGL